MPTCQNAIQFSSILVRPPQKPRPIILREGETLRSSVYLRRIIKKRPGDQPLAPGLVVEAAGTAPASEKSSYIPSTGLVLSRTADDTTEETPCQRGIGENLYDLIGKLTRRNIVAVVFRYWINETPGLLETKMVPLRLPRN